MQKKNEAIVILPAGIKQDDEGNWVSTELTEDDNALGAPGGSLRVLAGRILADMHPNALIVACGGKGFDVLPGAPTERPLLCEILRNELIKAGISQERIVLEKKSNTTFQNIAEIEVLCPTMNIDHVSFVTNRYHIQRLEAILHFKFQHFCERYHPVVFEAEDVLVQNDPRQWGDLVETCYQSEFMAKRVKKEHDGVEQIARGTYNFR